MKIYLGQSYSLNLKQSNPTQPIYQSTPSSVGRNYDKYPIGYIPHQINFGCPEWSLLKEIQELKKLPFLPCPYCGKEMIPPRIFDSLDNISQENYTKEAINLIKYFEHALFPVEKEVFGEVQKVHSTSPKFSFQEIMGVLLPEHSDRLKKEQIAVFNDVEDLSKGLSFLKRQKIAQIVKDAKNKIFDDENSLAPFKRKEYVKKITSLQGGPTEKKALALMQKRILELPSSENSVSAFIVKYAPKDSQAPERSNKEIADRLINRSVMNVEHLKTQSSYRNEGNLAGMNDIQNLAMTHSFCNGARGDTDLRKYVMSHRYIIKNAQKHIDYVIEKINNNTLVDCDQYPRKFKARLFEQSKGLIKLDISNLKIKTKAKAKQEELVLDAVS